MLDDRGATIVEERPSRKRPLTDDDARALLAEVETVQIARGKRVVSIAAQDTDINQLKGPTGNYRAPMVRRGETLLVGFHAEALAELAG